MVTSADAAKVAAPVALAAAGAFAGAAAWASFIEHPELMNNVSGFYSFFPGMYHKAARMQGGLAVLGSHAAMLAAAKSDDKNTKLMWGVSGALLGAVLPYTLFVMMPTNKKILSQDSKDEEDKKGLLEYWGKLHLVRTALSVTSVALMVATVVRSSRSSS